MYEMIWVENSIRTTAAEYEKELDAFANRLDRPPWGNKLEPNLSLEEVEKEFGERGTRMLLAVGKQKTAGSFYVEMVDNLMKCTKLRKPGPRSLDQIRAVMLKWLDENPEVWTQAANATVFSALRDKLCKIYPD